MSSDKKGLGSGVGLGSLSCGLTPNMLGMVGGVGLVHWFCLWASGQEGAGTQPKVYICMYAHLAHYPLPGFQVPGKFSGVSNKASSPAYLPLGRPGAMS